MSKLFILFLLINVNYLHSSTKLDSLYLLLDDVLEQKENFESTRLEHIANLVSLVEGSELSLRQEFEINRRIIEDYQAYSFDSTLLYIKRNVFLANLIKDVQLRQISHLDYANMLAYSGRYVEALDILQNLNLTFLDKDERILYHTILERVYSDLYIYASSGQVKDKYKRLSDQHLDSLLVCLDKDTDAYLSILEKAYRDERKLELCEKVNTRRMALATLNTRLYSTITFERSLIYELRGQREMEKEYLVLSAISDAKASVKDHASLTRLALILYEEGDIERAYKYIKSSFEDANFYNSRLRFISISNILPLITEAYQAKTDSQRKTLAFFTIFISILLVLLMLLLLFILRQIKRISKARKEIEVINNQYYELNQELQASNLQLKELNKDYLEASQVKEHYIGSFLSICSEYIEKLDNYRKMVNKSIKSKKIEELYQRTRSNQLLEDEMVEFYDNFDNIFLHIYPNFVEEFNKLLVDEAKIVLKKGDVLSTELRIFALIRLGITDSASIAKLLRYSTSTIYNYRVKLRNNAKVPRDEFKDYVMKINATMQ